MWSGEIISIEDSPVKALPVETSNINSYGSNLALHDDSDDSLPDLPLIHSFSRSQQAGVLQSSTVRGKDLPWTQLGKYPACTQINSLTLTSPPVALEIGHGGQEEIIDLDSSDEELVVLPQDIDTESTVRAIARPHLQKSQTLPAKLPSASQNQSLVSIPSLSSSILLNIDKLMDKASSKKSASVNDKSKRRIHSKSGTPSDESTDEEDTQRDEVQIKRAKKSNGSQSSAASQAKAEKAAEREVAKQKKVQEKEAKLQEKRKAQSIAAVNTLKNNKKESAPEMIVELCDSFRGSAVHTHVESFMEGLGCTLNLRSMPVPGLIRFRRHVKARYDAEKGYWLPLDEPTIEEEDQLIVLLKAQEYVKIATNETSLARHVKSVRSIRQSAKVLYLIEGLAALLRKSQAAKNRAYQSAVRSMAGETIEPTRTKSKTSQPAADLSEEAIEDSLIDLQVLHGCLIVHSTAPADTAEQLSVLTSDLSTVPYKQGRENSALAFCTEVGQIRTGSDARDTFEKMLQSITRVTPQIAQAIAARYTSLQDLCRALAAGPGILQNIPKGHNVDGRISGQLLGAATSLKIHRALMSTDAHADA